MPTPPGMDPEPKEPTKPRELWSENNNFLWAVEFSNQLMIQAPPAPGTEPQVWIHFGGFPLPTWTISFFLSGCGVPGRLDVLQDGQHRSGLQVLGGCGLRLERWKVVAAGVSHGLQVWYQMRKRWMQVGKKSDWIGASSFFSHLCMCFIFFTWLKTAVVKVLFLLRCSTAKEQKELQKKMEKMMHNLPHAPHMPTAPGKSKAPAKPGASKARRAIFSQNWSPEVAAF